jgi:quercetin dioxygenase-like cupin family protein
MVKPASPELGAVFDLAAIEHELRREEPYAREGHTGRTLVREPDLRVVLIAIRAGERMAEHAANATMSIYTLAGLVRVRLPRLDPQHEDRMVELPSGQLLALERGLTYDIEAVTNGAFLLTLGWCGEGSPSHHVAADTGA